MRMAKYDPFSIITGRKKKKGCAMRMLRWLVLTNVTQCRLVIFINSMSLSQCSPESWLKQKQALSVAVQHARDPTGNCNFKRIYLLNHYIHTTKQYGRFSIAGKHWWSELCITELFKSAILKPAANIIDAAILNGGPQSENSRQSDSAGCVAASFYFHILRI